ncbi:MAG: hypothetical protein M3R71_04565, partial [Actinomycetota bacterium]|nr:hypothetical protein [Actinomycetota bacterium]
ADRRQLQKSLDERLARAGRHLADGIERSGRWLGAVDTKRSLRAGVERAESRLLRGHERLEAAHPGRRVEAARRQLRAMEWKRPIWGTLGRAQGRVDAEGRHLRALGPRRVLQRGYAIVTSEDGAVIRRAVELPPGAAFAVTLSEGCLSARVLAIESE